MSTTTFNHTITTHYNERTATTSVLSKFINWCDGQQKNRFMWLGAAVAGHGCMLTPLTVLAVVAAGNSLVLFMAAIAAMAMALVTNLAALPTKITIPVFFFSILVDVAILIASAVLVFSGH